MFITKVKFIKQLENIPLRLSDAKRVLLTMIEKFVAQFWTKTSDKKEQKLFLNQLFFPKKCPQIVSHFLGAFAFSNSLNYKTSL